MSEQKLLQIHRQIIELAQKQDNCNSCLGLMLSSAESFSNRFGIKKNQKLFESYNLFHSGDLKNESDLKLQLGLHIKIFRNLVNHEKKKGRNYTFPENLGPEEIKKLIYMWKNNVKKEDQIYYDNILSILEENFDIKFPNNPQKSNHTSNQGIDPNHIMNVVPNVMGCIDYRLNKIGLEAEKTGVINNKIMMGSTESFNPELNGLKFIPITKGLNPKEEEKKKLMDIINETFYYAECYYYLYCQKLNLKVKLVSKYGNISDYLSKNFEDIEKKATNYAVNFKKIFTEYINKYYEIEFIRDYYQSAIDWYYNTNNELFLMLKKIFEEYK